MAGLPDAAALEGLGRFRQQRPHFRHFIGPDAKGVGQIFYDPVVIQVSPPPIIVMTLYLHFLILVYTKVEVNAMNTINVTSAPKTATFQMRINPEVKQRMEEIYARQGLSFTDAVNIFIQQSLNMEGLPFLASPENAEYMKAKAMRRLLDEAEKGWKSAEKDGWVSEEDAYRTLGVTE